jgi:hypothetical protein
MSPRFSVAINFPEQPGAVELLDQTADEPRFVVDSIVTPGA